MSMVQRMVVVGVALVPAACGPENGTVVTPTPTHAAAAAAGSGDVTATSLARINAYRARAGVPVLRGNRRLADAAAAHAADLFTTGRLSHAGADGSSVGDRVRRGGHGFCYVAENLARGPGSVDGVLSGWLMSPGHRRNMLSSQAEEVGLARRGDLWVMVLGRGGC